MQDVIPPRRQTRDRPAQPARPVISYGRPASPVVPARQARVISDVSIATPKPAVVPSVVPEAPAAPPVAAVPPVVRPPQPAAPAPVAPIVIAQPPVQTTSLPPQKPQEKTPKKTARKRRNLIRGRRWPLVGLAVVLLLLTGYVAYDTLMTNNRIRSETEQPVQASATPTAAAEGTDETEVSTDMLSSYQVAAHLPRALYIDKLSIAARILPMGVNDLGAVQSPINVNDAGWYNGSVEPGETGAMFIDGHASGATRQGLFAYLDTLTVGDEIQVEKGDGERLTYRVLAVETKPLEGFDMKRALLPYGNALRGLNIMTCTGEWIDEKKTYDHRVVVYTEQVTE